MNKLPDFRASLGRHGHNLTHDFSFTSGTGHLLTLFSNVMYPKDTIKGRCDMFTRTQPLLNPANVEIDEFIDYFFVPLDMLMSGFGDLLYQVNEVYSTVTRANLSKLGQNGVTLPVAKYADLFNELGLFEGLVGTTGAQKLLVNADKYEKDWRFFSVYRNIFHNFMNPNSLFDYARRHAVGEVGAKFVWPIDMWQPNTLPLTLMAYNCCYEHFYRLDEMEDFDPSIFNIDKDIYDGNDLFSGHALELLSLKYRPKQFDYFTGSNVRPFVNPTNLLENGNNLLQVNNYLSSSGIRASTVDNVVTAIGNSAATQLRFEFTGNQYFTATGNLRSLFAVEKLMQITNRAKKTYDAQVLAHLGVDVPHDVKHEIIHIGTQRSQIKIGEVVSTAGTSDTPLGDIAGKGYAVMGDDGIDFTAPCHGVFIGIYSCVPRFRYYAPLPKEHQISSLLDFFIPEYEKLGQQPIFGYEGTPLHNAPNGSDLNPVRWQMRYEQYKRKFNRVSPAFVDTIVQSQDSGTQYQGTTIQSFNGWHNWTVVRRPFDIFSVPNTSYLANRADLNWALCGANELNGIMAVDFFDFEAWSKYVVDNPSFFNLNETAALEPAGRKSLIWNLAQLFYRDPLVHFCRPNFKVVNKMSDNTLPDFIS